MGKDIKAFDEDQPCDYGDDMDKVRRRIADLSIEVRNHKIFAAERGKVLTSFVDYLMGLENDEAKGQGRLKLGAG